MCTIPVTICSPRFVRRCLGLLLAHHSITAGRLASMRAEITLIGRSRTISFTSASSAHYLGCAGKHYITTRFLTSFETRKSFPRSRSQFRGAGDSTWSNVHVRRWTRDYGARIDILRKYNSQPPATLIDLVLVGGPDRPIPQPKDNIPASPGSNQSYADRTQATKDSLAGVPTVSMVGSAAPCLSGGRCSTVWKTPSIRSEQEARICSPRCLLSTPALAIPLSYDENRRKDLLRSSRGEVGSAFDFLDAPGG